MKKFKFLKDHKGADGVEFKAGTIAELNDAAFKALPDGTVELYVEGAAPAFDQAKFEKTLQDAIGASLKEFGKANKFVSISVVREPADEGFKCLGDQMMAAKDFAVNRKMDKRQEAVIARYKAATGMNETVDADGGFLVQPEFQTDLWRAMHAQESLLDLVKRVPIGPNANGIRWNAIDETSRVSGQRLGGLNVYWTAEAGPATASKPRIAPRSMALEKLTGLYYVTDELMEDAPALSAMATQWFDEEFNWVIQNSILRGGGAGQPLGILNSGALVTVDKENAQAAKTILGLNIVKMYSRMWTRGHTNGVWLVNQDIYPQLLTLTIPTGTTAQMIFMPPSGVSGNQYGTLFGRPIRMIEQASTLGTVGDIMYVDPSQYMVIEKGGVKASSSIHVRFAEGETAFRFSVRMNGQPLWQTAITPANGTNTFSPFIALATRG